MQVHYTDEASRADITVDVEAAALLELLRRPPSKVLYISFESSYLDLTLTAGGAVEVELVHAGAMMIDQVSLATAGRIIRDAAEGFAGLTLEAYLEAYSDGLGLGG